MDDAKFTMFENRLTKQFRHLSKTARRQSVSCFRIYDQDLPEFPLLIELYDGKVCLSEYKRNYYHQMTETEHEAWIAKIKQITGNILGIQEQHIYERIRARKTGRQSNSYEKQNDLKSFFTVEENGLKFLINLTDYLDTGLFLDHRMTRKMVRDLSIGKRFLNLFCYTGSFSVYAAAAGALKVESVDMSNTYLKWAEDNMSINRLHKPGVTSFVREDALKYIKEAPNASFDLILLDPPSFSNSKKMEGILDIQKDHPMMIRECLRLLDHHGKLIFSNNLRNFSLDRSSIKGASIRDITGMTTPFDFTGKLKRWCYLIEKED